APAILAALANGLLEVVILYYLYVAVSGDEVSRVFSLGGIGPVVTLIFGWIFLHETLGLHQMGAFVLFVAGGFLLSTRFRGTTFSLSKALKPLIIGSLLGTGFTLLLRFAFIESNFWAGFFYSRAGFFIGGLFVYAWFHREITAEWNRHSN